MRRARSINAKALDITTQSQTQTDDLEFADPDTTCESILESLQRPRLSREERRRRILEAEVLPFRGQQAASLVPLLGQFIEENRQSNDPDSIVATGSAIRSFMAFATVEDALQAASSLLATKGRNPLPVELEVEVVKMVVRKLTANPATERDRYPELAARLKDLIDAYTWDRLLAREKFGAVAFNALLGLVLTRSGPDAEIVERMRALNVPWFQQLLARRATRLKTDLTARGSTEALGDLTRVLEQLSALDCPTLAS